MNCLLSVREQCAWAFTVGNVLVTSSAVYNSGMYDQRTDGCRLDRINYEN